MAEEEILVTKAAKVAEVVDPEQRLVMTSGVTINAMRKTRVVRSRNGERKGAIQDVSTVAH
jgi:hypothetical protein